MSDNEDDLVKQMNLALEAFVATFQQPFFAGSPVQRAAFQIEEMRGGRTMESRRIEMEETQKAEQALRDKREAEREREKIAEARQVLRDSRRPR